MDPEVRQALIYDYLRYCRVVCGTRPSYVDIASACNLSIPTVWADLEAMRSRGSINWRGKHPQSLRITGPFQERAESLAVG